MSAASPVSLPSLGRGSNNPRRGNVVANKTKGSPNNASILSFFKKADDMVEDLFVSSKYVTSNRAMVDDMDTLRYNEQNGTMKRRKLDIPSASDDTMEEPQNPSLNTVGIPNTSTLPKTKSPALFLEESDPEDDEMNDDVEEIKTSGATPIQDPEEVEIISLYEVNGIVGETRGRASDESAQKIKVNNPPQEKLNGSKLVENESGVISHTRELLTSKLPPKLPQEETSMAIPMEDFADFEELGDFDEDNFEEGDEYAERRYMEEQARLEAEERYEEVDLTADTDDFLDGSVHVAESEKQTDDPTCPICSVSLGAVAEVDAAKHVNDCLDGNPSPLPAKKVVVPPLPLSDSKDSAIKSQADRFRKAPRAPRPGQANPFAIGDKVPSGGTAFSRLMSGHAEDAAWADAAASERASHGKPSYQRTCPFYKILPGFNICVDAFRYGAVEGCKAYFLSHFHSDHYIGLTSSWCHGPIYCSQVTANLVKQQLRVDPQYVITLEWEKKVEVPGSNGVYVTMISANHCPGSSLYLYEKETVKAQKSKLQRVLHCGDFRACKMHVEHPLLRPDVIDAVSGKKRDQKIDVCYLDTTYLNPKYAFPGQEAVIKACADMCVSLSKVRADETDGWETMKRDRAGAGMVKFVRKESSLDVDIKQDEKQEEQEFIEKDLLDVEIMPDPDAIEIKIEGEPKIKIEVEPKIKIEDEVKTMIGDSTKDAMQVMKHGNAKHRGRLLVVVGTYSIGKERICLGIARALKSKIYAPASKLRICRALEDPELTSLLTNDPTEAQVHMTPLFEIRAETLDDYLKDFKDHFSRAVGFRPSGWSYRPPNSRFTESPNVQTVLYSENWKSSYSMKELIPQRGSTKRASCFGVPYSEHSSFRELTMFCCALRIDKVIPTVNVGNAKSRERMKGWCEKWAAERKKNGLFRLKDGEVW